MSTIIKALSIRQPYLIWIQTGKKTIELRSWETTYRGPLLLCSSKKVDADQGLKTQLPLGHAVCVVNLYDVVEYTANEAGAALSSYQKNLFAWKVRLIKNIDPFPIKGKLGLFNVIVPKGVKLI